MLSTIMNGWIERKAKQRDDHVVAEGIIKGAVEDLWDALCQSIRDSAKKYSERFPPNLPPRDFIQISSPSAFDTVWVEVKEASLMLSASPGKSKRKVTVKIDRDKATINVAFDGTPGRPSLSIRIGITESGVAGFFMGPKELSLDDATECILSPVFYPDIKQQQYNDAATA